MKIAMINNINFKANWRPQKKEVGPGVRWGIEQMTHPVPNPENEYDADYKPSFSSNHYDYSGVFRAMNGGRIDNSTPKEDYLEDEDYFEDEDCCSYEGYYPDEEFDFDEDFHQDEDVEEDPDGDYYHNNQFNSDANFYPYEDAFPYEDFD